MRKGGESRYGKAQSDRSTKAECREPDAALSLVRGVERSLESDSSDGIGAQETYNGVKAPIAVIETTSFTTWQKDVTVRRKEYSRRGFLEYVAVHWKRVGMKARGALQWAPLSGFLIKP